VVTHYNRDEQIVGKYVEITSIPALLRSQTEDMAAGLRRLKARLSEGGGSRVD
jgi:hypothetical protein